jgi:protein MpaA
VSASTLRFLAAALVAATAAVLIPAAQVAREPRRPRSRVIASAIPVRPRRVVLGRSVLGRPIEATELGDPRSPVALLLVGCIHGNEDAGLAVARDLAGGAQAGPHMWVVDNLNPDGFAARTRQNAHGVDLNRNFPYAWRPLARATGQYSGPRALSEPETRVAYRLILRLRPRITIWLHQPFDVVDESGGNPAVERRFARLAGLPLRRLTRYPGSAVGWQNHAVRGSTAFVVELPPGRLNASAARRVAAAARTMASEAASLARGGGQEFSRLDREPSTPA